MDYRVLDLTIISAKDLKNVNMFSKMDVYALVSLSGDPRTLHRSPVDTDSGKNPAWNFPAKFSLDEAALHSNRLSLHFVLRAQRALGDRDIGEVHVPLKELFDAAPGSADGKPNFSSYQVRRPSGKPKGELNISYKFGDKISGAAAYNHAPPPPVSAGAHGGEKYGKGGDEPVMAYPAGTSSGHQYPPQQGSAAPYYPPQGGYGYGQPPPQYGYQQQPPQQYGYPPQYGYQQPMQAPGRKQNKFGGMGLGAGLLGGALGGLLIGDMISDAGNYDAGYDAGFDDGGGFDGGGFDF